MGETRDLFKKIRHTKVTCHAKMGTIKDRNYMDLAEAVYIKNGYQEYAEPYKKGLNDLENHDGVVTQLEPDILECEIMWTFGSIMTNLDNILKSRDIILSTEVHIVKTGFSSILVWT